MRHGSGSATERSERAVQHAGPPRCPARPCERAPLFEPGSRWEYSNYGFLLLGAVIEAVSGQSYYDYVADHVYRPAGMLATGSEPESEDVPGGGYSTVEDLLRFAEALQAGTLISPEMFAEATNPQGDEFYGFGFGVGTDPSPHWGHGGGAPGMNGELRV